MYKAHPLIISVLALVAVLACSPAYAADKGGVYIGVKGGYEYKDHNSAGLTDSTVAPNNANATKNWSGKSGYTVGGALGYNFSGMGLPVRAEAEYLYHDQFKYSSANGTAATSTGAFTSKIDIHTLFANFYYDIKTNTAFTPYVGAGLGVAWIKQKAAGNFANTNGAAWNNNGNFDATSFAWNLGGGVGYSLNDSITLDLGYRYTSFGDAKKASNAAGTLNFQPKGITSHEALLGLRYQF
ncbi:MAG: outer membrane beta-barrel protein [Proteobacteria bacterium]|nr:outer membrane beta-barrel protein [Pseudomonadota bacterium]MBU1596203.1 outer membrane beta-barrel protein [Pseudomonadota bacterium]